MLDPLTALSVAGNIIQFVDFGIKVLTKSLILIQDRKRVSLVAHELMLVTSDLKELCIKLNDPLKSDIFKHHVAAHYVALENICRTANALADELLARFNKLLIDGQARFHKWKCFREAVLSTWNEHAQQALVSRLFSLREMIEMHVLVGLREQLDIVALHHSDRFDALDIQTKNIVISLIGAQEGLQTRLENQTQKLKESLSSDLKVQTLAISQIMSRLEGTLVPMNHSNGGRLINEGEIRELIAKGLLDDLRFPTMDDRLEEVAGTFPQTFRWIFREPPVEGDEPSWSSFVHWLKEGDGIYWINGKAASGKSTLMRYICESFETMPLLRHWASPAAPTVAKFFFWNSGTLEQRSNKGLLRTILYDVFNRHPELIPVCLPLQWARRYSRAVGTCIRMETNLPETAQLTIKNLMAAFSILLKQQNIPIKLCLFIDGLDEYDGSFDDMVDLFRVAASSQHVKVCLSSRPLLPFEDAFSSGDSLRLQDLTYSDISHYVSNRLSSNQRYQQLLEDEPVRLGELVQQIVRKANGVFLWVKLVIGSLLSGLCNRDNLRDLQKRVNLIPGDLEHLYSHMLKKIPDFYKSQASETFQLVRAARLQRSANKNGHDNSEPLTIIELSLADDEDPQLAITARVAPLSSARTATRCELIRARLRVRCLGLLEVHGSREHEGYPFSRIQYLHRTTRDYLERSDVWSDIVVQTKDSDFNPNLSLLKACVLQLKWRLYSDVTPQHVLDLAMSYARTIEITTGKACVDLLDQLDLAMQKKVNAIRYSSFITIAAQNGLCSYLSQKLASDKDCLKAMERGDSILKQVLQHPETNLFDEGLESIEILLHNGADPNEEHKDSTPWGGFLLCTYAARTKLRDRKSRFNIVKLLLRYGADPNICISVDGKSYSAAYIIRGILGKEHLKEISELSPLLFTQERTADLSSMFLQIMSWIGFY